MMTSPAGLDSSDLPHLPPTDEEDPHSTTMSIDTRRQRFPFCLVWGPLPCITWLFPFIGHMGIADSEGKVHDFAGPYYIGIDSFMVGDVCKYYRFPMKLLQSSSRVQSGEYTPAQLWDEAISLADRSYVKQMHNICCNNCHHHVAEALRTMGFHYTMWSAWWTIMLKGRYTTWGAVLQTYLPFIIVVSIIVIVSVFA